MLEVSILYSNHRPEIIPEMEKQVRHCDLLITEDAPSAQFQDMLAGAASIEDYLQTTDIEYPEFGRRLCLLWRQLHDNGTLIVQAEPFVETLLDIHEYFAAGGDKRDIPGNSLRHKVYRAEKQATAALIEFYQAASNGGFDTVVDATKRFALLDARRFVLRDRLRAPAIAALCDGHKHVCVEAGQIHQALGRYLKHQLPADSRVKPVFLMRPVVKRFGRKCHLFGPGDLLTLMYVFHPGLDSERHTLLAARALIYNKVVVKEELIPDKAGYPHTLDEIQSIALVNRLSRDDCRRLFDTMRRSSTARARRSLVDYLSTKA